MLCEYTEKYVLWGFPSLLVWWTLMVAKTRGLLRPLHILGACYEDTQGSKADKNLTGPRNSHQSGFKTALLVISTQHLSFPWILITNQLISVFPHSDFWGQSLTQLNITLLLGRDFHTCPQGFFSANGLSKCPLLL